MKKFRNLSSNIKLRVQKIRNKKNPSIKNHTKCRNVYQISLKAKQKNVSKPKFVRKFTKETQNQLNTWHIYQQTKLNIKNSKSLNLIKTNKIKHKNSERKFSCNCRQNVCKLHNSLRHSRFVQISSLFHNASNLINLFIFIL